MKTMFARVLVVVVAVVLVALAAPVVAQPKAPPPPKAWKGRTVVLLQPLYTFVTDGMYGAERRAVVRVSEEHGVYYQSGRDRDTDVNRLAQLSTTKNATKPTFAYHFTPVPAAPLQMLTFEAGTTMIVCKVQENDVERSYLLSLALPISPKTAVTYLTIVQRTGTFSTADASPDALIRTVLKEAK